MKNPCNVNENFGTIRKFIECTVSCFEHHQIDSPRLTAEMILAHALDMDKTSLYLYPERPISGHHIALCRDLVARRIAREPLAYILGEAGFWSLMLHVTSDVLIPRPDTECLVETALAHIPEKKSSNSPMRIIDLGTGSGAIILSLAKERPGHVFLAVDASMPALRLSVKNAIRNDLEPHVAFFRGNWLDSVSRTGAGVFDMIVSNPPYIPAGDIPDLEPEVRCFEPFEALNGGKDGLDDLRHIVTRAPLYLRRGGMLFLEIGFDQEEAVAEIIRKNGNYAHVVFHKDLAGHTRVVSMEKGFQSF